MNENRTKTQKRKNLERDQHVNSWSCSWNPCMGGRKWYLQLARTNRGSRRQSVLRRDILTICANTGKVMNINAPNWNMFYNFKLIRYPFEPPRVRFITPVFHPNIDGEGRICLDTLKMQPQVNLIIIITRWMITVDICVGIMVPFDKYKYTSPYYQSAFISPKRGWWSRSGNREQLPI